MAMLCVAVGVAPALTVAPVLHAGAGAILGDALPNYSLAIWHGFNKPLMMSLAGTFGGIALYFGANDMGSLMIEENVVSSAGTVFHLSLEEMKRAIREAGYIPRQRNVFYEYIDAEPVAARAASRER